jgi:hypothetical protein
MAIPSASLRPASSSSVSLLDLDWSFILFGVAFAITFVTDLDGPFHSFCWSR